MRSRNHVRGSMVCGVRKVGRLTSEEASARVLYCICMLARVVCYRIACTYAHMQEGHQQPGGCRIYLFRDSRRLSQAQNAFHVVVIQRRKGGELQQMRDGEVSCVGGGRVGVHGSW